MLKTIKNRTNKAFMKEMKCSIATLNCNLAVCPPLRFNGAFARAARLVDSLYSCISPYDLDIVCMQELISGRQQVLKDFIHHPFHTQIVESSLWGNNIRLIHSGLAIVSKWPILEEDGHVFYGQTYNMESFMAKAVLYTKILMHETIIVHVFNTHLQAWTNPRASVIRLEQMRQISEFMQRKLIGADRKTQLVLLCADLNLDAYEHAEKMKEMMDVVGCSLIMPSTPQFSFDSSTNPLVGLDDSEEYIERSKLEGCHDDFMQNGICSCCPKQLIDGVAVLKEQLDSEQLVIRAVTNVIPIISRAPFEMFVNVSTRRTLSVISDHNAVYTQFYCRTHEESALKFQPVYRNKYRKKLHLGWILLQIVIFLLLLLMFWAFCSWIAKRRTKS